MSKLFLGGIPTDGDVRKLIEYFKQPVEGTEMLHEEIEQVLEIDHKASRYRSVTLAWRKKLLRDHNIHVSAVPGVGFRCLTADERISEAITGVQVGARKTVRSVRSSERVVTDDPILQQKKDVLQRYGLVMISHATNAMKEIAPPKPARQLPRLIPKSGDKAA